MPRPLLTLVTPALADAHNGNWQTARRYAALLAPDFRVDLRPQWQAGDPPGALLIALHARKSAPSIAAWPAQRPVLLVLTGTDLYRDIGADAAAQASLQRADALVLLNRLGAQALPLALRAKTRVILQSCAARAPGRRPQGHLRVLMVGHLRAEKDPETLFAAVQALQGRSEAQGEIRIDHIGQALDAGLALQARQLMRECPHYRWLGPLPHGETRRRIANASLLLHPSRMEGGAHVVMEALRSGTPVLASRVDGNVGLLGADWPLLFEPGDVRGLVAQLLALRRDPAILAHAEGLARERGAAFAPEHERRALLSLVRQLLEPTYVPQP